MTDDPVGSGAPVEGAPRPGLAARLRAWRARRKVHKAARSKLRRRLTRTGIGFALLVVVVVGASGIYLVVRLGEIGRVAVHVSAIPKSGADDILLVGSTDRCAVKPQQHLNNFVQQCAQGVNGVNSDVIMVLRLVPGRTPTLLSIPRDTFVPDARSGGLYNKVDAALANGPDQLVQAIEEDFGIPINHYVVLNFETFSNIVTALGGITMYFPTSLYDAQSGLDISHSGCLHISGLEALALVRARHLQYHYDKKTKTWRGYDGSGDIGRIERVHVFLKVLAQEIAAKGIGNPIVDNDLLTSLAPDLTVDTTFTTSSMLKLALDFHSNVGSAPELTLPVIEDGATYYYKGYNYGDVVFPAQPQDMAAIDAFIGDKPLGASVRPGGISVSVVDAAGDPAATASFETSLGRLGYKVSDGGTATLVGPVAETSLFYSGARHLAQATRVLRSLTGAAVLAKGPGVAGADVTVEMGSDVGVASPSAHTTGAPASAPPVIVTLLSALLSSSANSNLAAPTPAAEKIPPYDPRACPAKLVK